MGENQNNKTDAVDLGLPPEKESLLLAIDIHLEFLKYLKMVEKKKDKMKGGEINAESNHM